jgi:hypothetical protein
VDKEIERLTDGIRAGSVVEQLGRASHGDLTISQ